MVFIQGLFAQNKKKKKIKLSPPPLKINNHF